MSLIVELFLNVAFFYLTCAILNIAPQLSNPKHWYLGVLSSCAASSFIGIFS